MAIHKIECPDGTVIWTGDRGFEQYEKALAEAIADGTEWIASGGDIIYDDYHSIDEDMEGLIESMVNDMKQVRKEMKNGKNK
jgi:hypothetical protein